MNEKEKNQKLFALIKKDPELAPLSQEQKDAFLHFWEAAGTYERKRNLVGSISDLYCNRMRYRELLPPSERAEFDRIQLDPKVRI